MKCCCCCCCWRPSSPIHSPLPITPSSQGLTGRVVRELVVFSLCGQALLSHYCTHADAAAPAVVSLSLSLCTPSPQNPIQALFIEPPNHGSEANYNFNLSNATLQFPVTKNKLLLLLSPLLNIRLKLNYPGNTGTLINFHRISHHLLAHRAEREWEMAEKLALPGGNFLSTLILSSSTERMRN